MKTPRLAYPLVTAALFCHYPSAHAQRATSSVNPYAGQFVDINGNPATDLTTPVYKIVEDSLVPILGSGGEHWTLDDVNDVIGDIQISARPGGGTRMIVELEGLIPNERYSIWGSYFASPGFPDGERVAFGAVSERGDGSDNFANADDNGRVSLNLVQLAGPMTFFGSAPSYARMATVIDSNGVARKHTGYGVGIAYHFLNAPEPPFLTPGPPDTWVLVANTRFAPIPEPSSIVLAAFAVGAGVVIAARRRAVQAVW